MIKSRILEKITQNRKPVLIVGFSIVILLTLVRYVFVYMAFLEKEIDSGVLVSIEEHKDSGFDKDFLFDMSMQKAIFSDDSWVLEPLVSGLSIPWGMVWTSYDRALVTERVGTVRIIERGVLVKKPAYEFEDVSSRSEEGVMGIVLDPAYVENKFLYIASAYESDSIKVKVTRFRDSGDALENPLVILDNIPAARFHAGARIEFGPDGKLYITTGDAADKKIAQDLESLGGKILRINPDGSVPEDNPFPDNPIWSYGHRNSQGLDWHPITGDLYSVEHGPSVFDGPAGGDEVNRIEKGSNYGWPLVSHEEKGAGFVEPLVIFTPAEAPGSAVFYSGSIYPELKNNFLMSSLRGEGMIRFVISEDDPDHILFFEKLDLANYGRIRTLVQAPDGYIYVLTSNTDGRGSEIVGDDYIYRLSRKK